MTKIEIDQIVTDLENKVMISSCSIKQMAYALQKSLADLEIAKAQVVINQVLP